ncbi:hypothetical protein [Cellulomonas sp. RIT-PI-Y]|uniref:hypothetical protein n=1 Tax=Cellulomonas sp. RIT-PI-Y TaxID=3035297 RepID=UPI0021DA6D0A|nr:hypothetical protein [Cellulomonas sp. RIT-PI-Y]
MLSVVVAALFLVLIGYLTIRASMSRGGLALDLGNAPSHVQDPAVPWLAYLLIALVAGAVVALADRRVLQPAVVAGTVLVVVLLATGPSGQLDPFADDQSSPVRWAVRGADSPAVHVTAVVLAWWAFARRGRPVEAA